MTEITEFEKKIIQLLKNRHYSAAVHIKDIKDSVVNILDLAVAYEIEKYQFLVDEIQKIFDEASK